jgi:hypothetical protein
MIMFRPQNERDSHTLMLANNFFETVRKSKHRCKHKGKYVKVKLSLCFFFN